MKKLLCLITIFILFLTLPVFAEYKPIPKELSKQYKAEMEQIIEEEYPKIINKIDNAVLEGKGYYNKIVDYGYDDYAYKQLDGLANVYIFNTDLNLFCKLVKITQEKYLGIKYEDFGTDNTYTMEKYLQPYFEKNNVNTKKTIIIGQYMDSKSKILKNYLNMINKKYK